MPSFPGHPDAPGGARGHPPLPAAVSAQPDTHAPLLMQTLEQASDAVVVIDEHHRIAVFNPAAERLWGWPREEVLGRHVGMLMPPHLRQAHKNHTDALHAAGHTAGIIDSPRTVPVQRRDGTRRWAAMSMARIAAGPRVLYSAFFREITQQHRRRPPLSGPAGEPGGGAIAITDGALRIASVDTGFTRLLGYGSAQALGRRLDELLRGPHTNGQALAAMRAAAAAGQELQTRLLVYTGRGRTLWASATVSALHHDTGAPRQAVFLLRDTTPARAHETLRHKVLDAMAHGAPLHDTALLLCREVEQAAPEVTAVLLEVNASSRLRIVAAPSLPPRIEHLIDGMAVGSLTGCGCAIAAASGQPLLTADLAADPHWAPVRETFTAHGLRSCRAHPIAGRDGAVRGVLAFYYREPHHPEALHEQLAHTSLHLCTLLLEREHERAHIHQLAYYDTLTGLANRSMLNAQAARMLHEARRSGAPLALLFIDLDRFKQINDTQGHLIGDALLRAVAERLQDGARANDLAARLGGDEFVLLLTRCDARQAALTAERLLATIARPVLLQGATLRPRASMGIALFPDDGNDADTLLHRADQAMYQAKTAGGQRWCFNGTAPDGPARTSG